MNAKKKAVGSAKATAPEKSKPNGLAPLVAEVRNLIQSARRGVAAVVDTFQVMINFEIGRRIVEHEQKGTKRAAYGVELLKELSARLTEEFGRGFSETNLKVMRQFFLEYQQRIGQTTSDQSDSLRIGQQATDQSQFRRTLPAKLALGGVSAAPSSLLRTDRSEVADWSQAEIGYTSLVILWWVATVADWSQAEIGYTSLIPFSSSFQLRIGHRLRLVTLQSANDALSGKLRIGHRLRLVTLNTQWVTFVLSCGLVTG